MSKELIIIMCPPYPEYEEPPEDQSNCELFDCPKCKSKMWLSQNKKGKISFHSLLKDEIILCCYDCLKKIANDNPEFLIDAAMRRI